jgi:hypothetical protein
MTHTVTFTADVRTPEASAAGQSAASGYINPDWSVWEVWDGPEDAGATFAHDSDDMHSPVTFAARMILDYLGVVEADVSDGPVGTYYASDPVRDPYSARDAYLAVHLGGYSDAQELRLARVLARLGSLRAWADGPRYVVTVSTVGCLPESDPAVCGTLDYARAHVASEIARDWDAEYDTVTTRRERLAIDARYLPAHTAASTMSANESVIIDGPRGSLARAYEIHTTH